MKRPVPGRNDRKTGTGSFGRNSTFGRKPPKDSPTSSKDEPRKGSSFSSSRPKAPPTERDRVKKAAISALKKAKRIAARTGVELSEWEDEFLGGDENLAVRQAISLAIDRERINDQIYDGARVSATGVTPPGIPGFTEGLCEYCAYDAEAAQQAFDDWTAEGNSLDEPIPIQFNVDQGHEPGTFAYAQSLGCGEFAGQLERCWVRASQL